MKLKIKEVTKLNYYELLNIDPDVSKPDIQRAYYLSKKTYDPSSIAIYGLIDEEERKTTQMIIEEAYKTLMDDKKRKMYDKNIFLVPTKKNENTDHAQKTISDTEPKIEEDFSSHDFLKKIRLKKEISLNEISTATNINITILSALENGKFKELPCRVYTLGYLKQYAEYLNIDYQKAKENFNLLNKPADEKFKIINYLNKY